jgi:hypothetical protein
VRCGVAPELVRHQAPRFSFLPLQEFPKEPFRGTGISMSLNEYVDQISVLIDCPPEKVPLALDVHEDLVQVPDIAEPTLAPLEIPCVLGPKLPAPLSDGLVRDDNAEFRQKVLDISKAQAESVIQPDCVTDYFGRETVSAVDVAICIHQLYLAGTGSS